MNKTGKSGPHRARYRVWGANGAGWFWEFRSSNGRVIFGRLGVFDTRNKAVHDINRFEEIVKSKPRLEYEG